MRMLQKLLVVMALLFTFGTGPVQAQTDAAEAAEFQRIISAQIDAFKADDGVRAYSYAAPIIQKAFPTPEVFMDMVKRGYAPVYRQRSYSFGEITDEMRDRPTQRVNIIDENGRAWIALYAFEKQPDGSWKIIGCALVESQGGEA